MFTADLRIPVKIHSRSVPARQKGIHTHIQYTIIYTIVYYSTSILYYIILPYVDYVYICIVIGVCIWVQCAHRRSGQVGILYSTCNILYYCVLYILILSISTIYVLYIY